MYNQLIAHNTSDKAPTPSGRALLRASVCKVLLGLATTLIALPFTAFANDTNDDSHWYLGSALGDVDTDLTSQRNPSATDSSVKVKTINLEESLVGWKLNVGVDVTSNLAIEAGYMDMNQDAEVNAVITDPAIFSNFGNNSPTNATDGFTLGSVYRYNITDDIGLTGSVGVFNWEGDIATQALKGNEAAGDGKGGTDLYFGFGGGYKLSDDVSLSIEWEHYELNDDDTDMWSIGVNYHFK